MYISYLMMSCVVFLRSRAPLLHGDILNNIVFRNKQYNLFRSVILLLNRVAQKQKGQF